VEYPHQWAGFAVASALGAPLAWKHSDRKRAEKTDIRTTALKESKPG